MERMDGASEKSRQKISEELPMRLRWGTEGVGCEGVSLAKPMQIYLSEPLGGGAIKGGRFYVVAADVRGDNGNRGTCYLLVNARDVRCPKKP